MLIVYIFITVLLVPSTAFAWGPATHIDLALAIISNAVVLAPVVRTLITEYPDAFVYGSASPDIIQGKKFLSRHDHCHSWKVGRRILEKAKTNKQKSAAYGYLSHLAADVIAHNYYIPFKIMRSYRSQLLDHTYWEMVFDNEASENSWDWLSSLTADEEFDNLLGGELKRFIFSFKVNKAIFSTILDIQRLKSLRKSFELHVKKSSLKLEGRDHYWKLALESSTNFLKNIDGHQTIENTDPSGRQRLKEAKTLRNQLRNRKKIGKLSDEEGDKFLCVIKDLLEIGVYNPQLALPHFEKTWSRLIVD